MRYWVSHVEHRKVILAQREGRTDISDILWHLFSRILMNILICKLIFPKKRKYEKLQKITKNC